HLLLGRRYHLSLWLWWLLSPRLAKPSIGSAKTPTVHLNLRNCQLARLIQHHPLIIVRKTMKSNTSRRNSRSWSMRLGAAVMMVFLLQTVFVCAQQSPAHPEQPKTAHRGAAVAPRTPAQILADSRGSVAVIVAGTDKISKLGTGFFVRSSGL